MGDLSQALEERLLAGGCNVQRASGAAEALNQALEVLRQAGVTRADDGQPDGPRPCEPLAAGLTVCEPAVAQTGGQGQLAGPTGWCLLSLLPPLHVALLHDSAIVPDIEALATMLQDRQRFPQSPPALALIGRPEQDRRHQGHHDKGVHGPDRLEVILWA